MLKGILGVAACFLAAALLHCDYDVLGLTLILALYMTRKDKRAQCIAGAVFSLFEPVAPLAFGLVWFYSGERGRQLQTRAVGVLLVLPGPYFRPRHPYKPPAFPISKKPFS